MSKIRELPEPKFASHAKMVKLARMMLKTVQEKEILHIDARMIDKEGKEIPFFDFVTIYKSEWFKDRE